MTSPPDPGDLSPDQAELVGLLERVAMLPRPIHETDFGVLVDQIIPILEERTRRSLGDDHRLVIQDLLRYEAGLRSDGRVLAAEGMALLVLRWTVEAEMLASQN